MFSFLDCILLAKSEQNRRASCPKAPDVSTADGRKMFDLERRLYLAFFLSSAWLATALASLVACMMWEAAKVSTHVASQMRFRPVFQGVTVTPSGLFHHT